MATTRVVLVEDHDMVAEAMALAMQRADDIEIVARARSIATALTEVRKYAPDVVLLDRRLPDGDAIEAIGPLSELGARVLMLTGEATSTVAARVAEAGGCGLVLKSAGLDELEDAVRRVAEGEAVFGAEFLAGVLNRLTGRTRSATLTARERQTLGLLADGASTAEVARRLGVAVNTARNHVQRVLEKLGARSKLEAVVIARKEGLLD
ncbi:response regulator transcription factor [Actinophytocola sp.]|uniref:response regulator transcription factor n=1 Tax=Actinophytocola sp. TaxID=1872138 RepID=UPI002D63EDB2|nr:response regulator transcription factor [Actinophytocola sp.]HYQ64988.1 response regulator transcription factor [Actinophytocola sp.]